jgi:hypothetical protein
MQVGEEVAGASCERVGRATFAMLFFELSGEES